MSSRCAKVRGVAEGSLSLGDSDGAFALGSLDLCNETLVDSLTIALRSHEGEICIRGPSWKASASRASFQDKQHCLARAIPYRLQADKQVALVLSVVSTLAGATMLVEARSGCEGIRVGKRNQQHGLKAGVKA